MKVRDGSLRANTALAILSLIPPKAVKIYGFSVSRWVPLVISQTEQGSATRPRFDYGVYVHLELFIETQFAYRPPAIEARLAALNEN